MFFLCFTTTWMILRRDLLIFWLLHRNQLKPKKRRNKHWTLSPLRHPCFQSRFFLKIYPLSSLNLSPILCRLHRLWNALYPYPIKRTRTNQKIHLLLLLIKSSERQYILSFFFFNYRNLLLFLLHCNLLFMYSSLLFHFFFRIIFKLMESNNIQQILFLIDLFSQANWRILWQILSVRRLFQNILFMVSHRRRMKMRILMIIWVPYQNIMSKWCFIYHDQRIHPLSLVRFHPPGLILQKKIQSPSRSINIIWSMVIWNMYCLQNFGVVPFGSLVWLQKWILFLWVSRNTSN